MEFEPKSNLPKLDRAKYQGHAVVFWTLTLEERERGWLTPAFHQIFREIMLHAAVRYDVWCPSYCLMPDHLHLMWMGVRLTSDQVNAMKFLRTELEPHLGKNREWQHQAHDHVLREEERKRNAFAKVCFYILENPVRAELVDDSKRWPYYGSIVPGYPRMNPLEEWYWEKFWRFYVKEREEETLSS